METFMVVLVEPNRKRCITTVYRNSISSSTDFGEGIYCRTLEDAEALRRLVIERTDTKSDNIKILKTTTTDEII